MDEILKYDKEFSEAKFKTYVNNVFVQIKLGFMSSNLERVKHFMSEELYQGYVKNLDSLKQKNHIMMYDELNAYDVSIVKCEKIEDRLRITVNLISRALEYTIDKNTRKIISGDNTKRITRNNLLVFEKKIASDTQKIGRVCEACGATIDVNQNGKCSYCGTIYNLEKYNWILVSEKN